MSKEDAERRTPLLTAFDTFSGIGGNALAFRRFSSVAAYCEKCPMATGALRSLMKRSLLDNAPILPDITTVDVDKLPPFNFLTASWPCQGNSALGKRKGMDDPRSGLIKDVLRILSVRKPPVVFLENVKEVVQRTNGSFQYVAQELQTLEYDFAWMILKASQVGRPHVRARFFLVGLRRDCSGIDIETLVEAARLNKESELQRMNSLVEPDRMLLTANVLENRKLLGLFGNSVVPGCCACAFYTLINKIVEVRKVKPIASFSSEFNCPAGVSEDNTVYNSAFPRIPETTLALVFDPKAFKTDKKISSQSTSAPVVTPQEAEFWSTPRYGANHSCNYLTERSIRDLATQVRFERSTPDSQREGSINPAFVQWLMGFPAQYIC